jgi:hypothetical protein
MRSTRFLKCSPLSGASLLLVAAAPFILGGCGASAPRFRGSALTTDTGDDENEIRFASKIREEVAREDDRKVDLSQFRKHESVRPGPHRSEERTPEGLNRDRMLLEAVSYLGVPYLYGGTNKEGVDCSAFTAGVYRKAAQISLPRSAREQFRTGRPVDPDSLQFGDLVFFNTTGRGPSHVGIYIEDSLFAHASVTSGVTISSLESTYYKNRYVGARRVASE